MARKRREKVFVRDLADDCHVCRALAGERCRNYKGRGKQPCTWRVLEPLPAVCGKLPPGTQRTLWKGV